MVIKFKELGTHQIPGHQAAAEQGGKEEKEGYLISPGKIRPCQYIPCHRGQQNRRYRPNHCYKMVIPYACTRVSGLLKAIL